MLRLSKKLEVILIFSSCTTGCAPLVVTPLVAASSAAETRTGKSIADRALSSVMDKDCSLKRVLKSDEKICAEKKP